MPTISYYLKSLQCRVIAPPIHFLKPAVEERHDLSGHTVRWSVAVGSDYILPGLGWVLLGCPSLALLRFFSSWIMYAVITWLIKVALYFSYAPSSLCVLAAVLMSYAMITYNHVNDGLLAERSGALDEAGASVEILPVNPSDYLIGSVGIILRWFWIVVTFVSIVIVTFLHHHTARI